MPRYVAFLRAINVGGHVVTMDRLRAIFDKAGHRDVETFIASGNVIFTPAGRATAAGLERKIAAELKKALGYEVATFLRTAEEVEATARAKPFPAAALATPGASLYVGFLEAPPSAAAKRAILAMATSSDELAVHGRELYWLGKKGFANAEFAPRKMERALRLQMTFRNITSVRKLAARLAATTP